MKHLLLSTWHFGRLANEAGWPILCDRERSLLDVLTVACEAVEDAEEVLTVGRGYPDAAGMLSVDGCIMLSPR
ncbi:MAG: glycosylasparaginase, partial [Planctomycetota bacterium]